MSCVVLGCRSHSSKKKDNEPLSFHTFPRDVLKRKEWVYRIGRRNWTPKPHSWICSKHFTPDSFIQTDRSHKWRRLRENAVPTLGLRDAPDEMVFPNPAPMDIFKSEHSYSLPIKEELPWTSNESFSDQSQDPLRKEVVKTERSLYFDIEEELPPFTIKTISNQSNKSTRTAREISSENDYKLRIQVLEKQLERVKKINKRRLRKINALHKQISRLGAKNYNLFELLVKRQEATETEYNNEVLKIDYR